jgi:hypothetical protein
MKIHRLNFFIIILFFLTSCASLHTKGFECVSYSYWSDSTGKIITDVSFYAKNEKAKLSWIRDTIITEMYFRPDSIALVNPSRKDGWIMAADSAGAYFSSAYPYDSLIDAIPTAEQKNISGYDCYRINVLYRSGKKREFWVTSEIDSEICHYFVKYWDDFWENDGTEFLIRKLNSDNKMIVCRRNYDKNGAFRSETTIRKIGQRPVAAQEIQIPADIKITASTPQKQKGR